MKPQLLTNAKPYGGSALAGWLETILTIFWVCIWIVVAGFIVLPLVGVEGGAVYFEAPISRGLSHEAEGPGGLWRLDTEVVRVTTPPDRMWIASAFVVPFLALVGFVVGELRAIFRSLRQGSPFVAANARRLRRMGLGVLALEVMRVLATAMVLAPAMRELEPAGGVASAWPDFEFVFLGLSFLVLSEVFRRGTQMQDEQALTV